MSFHDDGPDEEWVDDETDDSEAETLFCPSCRGEVYEETQKCPHCGEWITPVYNARGGFKSGWFIAVVLLLILAFLTVYVL